TDNGEYVASFKTAWESLLLVANGYDTKRTKPGARVDRVKLRQIDLHWHDLRHHAEPWIMPSPFICPRSCRLNHPEIPIALSA
ncbi:MAG TPA: hypothetical protein VJ755_07535, partial [Gemmatimonadales bacterium]|nr:hypothetical protein [Gemmatimonadales bacterium]